MSIFGGVVIEIFLGLVKVIIKLSTTVRLCNSYLLILPIKEYIVVSHSDTPKNNSSWKFLPGKTYNIKGHLIINIQIILRCPTIRVIVVHIKFKCWKACHPFRSTSPTIRVKIITFVRRVFTCSSTVGRFFCTKRVKYLVYPVVYCGMRIEKCCARVYETSLWMIKIRVGELAVYATNPQWENIDSILTIFAWVVRNVTDVFGFVFVDVETSNCH